ncbi:unnamed protein product [Cyprideis torosa]|uniref:Uncharacterized protein n=1 Tax=Cyprideis torosa TaxID=163714 RepID=A0A7R8W562_9CRUS|nr:unnamed protein product [Cyprideis torosa]CAG0884920.1 unnamed protein product [Cyprideis torosa]
MVSVPSEPRRRGPGPPSRLPLSKYGLTTKRTRIKLDVGTRIGGDRVLWDLTGPCGIYSRGPEELASPLGTSNKFQICQMEFEEKTTVFDQVLRWGLFLGAMFQLVCILAVTFVPLSDVKEDDEDDDGHEGELTSHASRQHVKRRLDKKKRR